MVDKKDIVKILESENIKFDLIEHEAVYTMDDIEKLNLGNYGTEVKNLFLRDEKGKNHFLIIAKEDTKIDMKELKNIINSSRLSFASEDRLKKYLNLIFLYKLDLFSPNILILCDSSSNKLQIKPIYLPCQ